ncbi:hypothetical protein [Parasphingorhabdus sp.]|uniref:hypothetical protein n=1 Tax=Parasphingorhabdus sp. TaxID=2709688 RepID=UPI0032664BB4
MKKDRMIGVSVPFFLPVPGWRDRKSTAGGVEKHHCQLYSHHIMTLFSLRSRQPIWLAVRVAGQNFTQSFGESSDGHENQSCWKTVG